MTRLELTPMFNDDGEVLCWSVWHGPTNFKITRGHRDDWEARRTIINTTTVIAVSDDLSDVLAHIEGLFR
jgi:hypothetical protein